MENLKLKDFLDYKFLSELELSPDKKYGAFVMHSANYESNKYLSNIWILNCATLEYKKLTSLNEEKNFIWLDNNTILFPSMRDEKLKKEIKKGEQWTVYYTIDIHGGEANEYMRIPMKVTDIKKIADEMFLFTATYDHYGINLHSIEEEKSKAIEIIKDNKDYEILDEIPFWTNGEGFTNKKRNMLYLYDKGANNIVPISKQFENISITSIKDGKALFVSECFTNKAEQTNELYLYELYSKEATCLVDEEEGYNIEFAEFVGNNIIFSGSLMDEYGLNQNCNFYKINNNNIVLLYRHDFGLGDSVGSDCRFGGGADVRVYNNSLYFISTESKSSYIKKLSLDGEIEKLTTDNGSIDCFDICNEGILFIGLRGTKLQEIYKLNSETEKQITKFNEIILETKNIIKPEPIEFINDDMKIEGFVLKPVNYNENKSYPGILDIHGGPKTVFGEVFYHEMQYWANEGYFVFYCNPRGSDGRGDEFADIRGKYGTIDYDDIMKFTDFVLQKYPQIDSKRIGVTGGSYGGFMTNWIIGHTDRFKCAVSQRSISNWISKFGTTDIGYYFNSDQNLSTPWDNVEKMWWHSPLKYANQVVTPTLFIHSEEDYRCWLAEGLQMFTALKYHGVDARLCMFKGENHELSRSGKPKHRVRRLEEMTNWFKKYLSI
ncbi:alpha/beta hydrolase family protein [Sedimentibacter sp. MB31-C6]|uniref:alpha/beta hydrolase family protein n=1 Tax=Sedimentibacter sp. MB31-C6 TaxID=3109366 RepID=UPI002DDCCE81|nr:S9 family peptidase [Sedimentibacter sp. MB36-C1]WSI05251.1 S9 family peptidase [Sedimentibacter sp. MB36-C1]